VLALSVGCSSELRGQGGVDGGAHVLYVTHSGGFRHDCLPTSAQVLADVGHSSGLWNLEVNDDAAAVLTAEHLATVDAVVFFTTGDLGLDAGQKQALLDFVAHGGGFAGCHNPTDTEYGGPEYHDLLCATVDGHPWHQQVTVLGEQPSHPAVQSLGASFSISTRSTSSATCGPAARCSCRSTLRAWTVRSGRTIPGDTHWRGR